MSDFMKKIQALVALIERATTGEASVAYRVNASGILEKQLSVWRELHNCDGMWYLSDGRTEVRIDCIELTKEDAIKAYKELSE